MSVKKFDLEQIVVGLRSDPALSSLSNRIYSGALVQNNPAGTYVTMRNISQNFPDQVYRFVRVEFRIRAHTSETSDAELRDVLNMIENVMETKRVFGTFEVYNIVAGSDYLSDVDEDGNKFILVDWIFYHTV